MRNVVSQNGLRGFMAGWKIHLLLFPMVMINMVLANIVFLQLKKLLFTPSRPRGGSSGGGGRGPLEGGLRRSGEGIGSRTTSITSIEERITTIEPASGTTNPTSTGTSGPTVDTTIVSVTAVETSITSENATNEDTGSTPNGSSGGSTN